MESEVFCEKISQEEKEIEISKSDKTKIYYLRKG